MKKVPIISKLLALMFALLGIAAGTACVYLAFDAIGAEPVLLEQPQAAKSRTVAMLEAVCAGNYDAAGEMMLGQPELGADRSAADPVGAMIWDAFTRSMSYELEGELYATDSGVAQNIRFTCMDLDAVTEKLGQRSRELLEERVAQAEDVQEVYDEHNNYREELVLELLYQAAREILEENPPVTQVETVVELVYAQEQWWVVPDSALLEVVSGGILN